MFLKCDSGLPKDTESDKLVSSVRAYTKSPFFYPAFLYNRKQT